ncbi:protein PTHB1-like, partial [Lingula anatina]|uniref:Protein PTHB1-like n=1 Tax=Lingula anatina TaxID=7574 RepID=A0A1S3JFJ5_LINAN
QAQGVEISDSEGTIPSITVKVSIKAKTAVQNVRFSVHTALPLAASQTQYQFSTLDSNRPGEVLISFFLKNDFMPSDLSAEITATYQNAAGAPRVAQALISLPIKLVIHPCLPVKMATHKVTIDTNKPPVSLNDIFPDLLGENAGGPGNALGFQFYGGVVVTMLASKTSQRYRLQSDVFQAMWIMTNELVKRLEKYFMARRATDFQCSFSGTMPLAEYFDVVDHHFEVRLKDLQMKEVLGQRAAQFRAIQRRLLTKFKDKTPSPLANLDTLLDGTYRQVTHPWDCYNTAAVSTCYHDMFDLL